MLRRSLWCLAPFHPRLPRAFPELHELIAKGYVKGTLDDAHLADPIANFRCDAGSTKLSWTLYRSLAEAGAIADVTLPDAEEVFANMTIERVQLFELAAADLLTEPSRT
jgi:hypothetical protein